LRAIGDQTWLEVQEPPWRIIYRIADKKTVEIHAVFDGRRSLEDILMERLLRV
jgi:plasmid stabilization system protein ParE